jgi:hypothetical protein
VSNTNMSSSRFAWSKPLLREGISWAVFLWGIIVGLFFTTFFAGMKVGPGRTTEWSAIFGVGVLGFGSLLASVLALRSRRQAARVFLLATPVILLCFARWLWHGRDDADFSYVTVILFMIGTAAFLILPGSFWLVSSRRGWQALIRARETATRQPRLLNAALLVLLAFGCSVASLCLFSYESGCNVLLPPVSAPSSPMQAVFAGKVLFFAVNRFAQEEAFQWAIVRVDHVYWGLPVWMRGIVFVRGYFSSEYGRQYFVDAHRSSGILTRFLPVLEYYPCWHTAPIGYAEVDLRVLRDGPPKSGGRIIGRLWRLRFSPGRNHSESVPDTTVTLSGPSGIVSTTTDSDGIYDFRELPPGRYSIRVDSQEYGATDLKVGDVRGGDLWLRNQGSQ